MVPFHQYDEFDDEPDVLPVSANWLPPILGLIGIGALVYGMSLAGLPRTDLDGALSQCAAIADGAARLGCYDHVAAPHAPAKGALAPLAYHPHEKSP